jgi:hypothetical protein
MLTRCVLKIYSIDTIMNTILCFYIYILPVDLADIVCFAGVCLFLLIPAGNLSFAM